jgi:hypothetical protein
MRLLYTQEKSGAAIYQKILQIRYCYVAYLIAQDCACDEAEKMIVWDCGREGKCLKKLCQALKGEYR